MNLMAVLGLKLWLSKATLTHEMTAFLFTIFLQVLQAGQSGWPLCAVCSAEASSTALRTAAVRCSIQGSYMNSDPDTDQFQDKQKEDTSSATHGLSFS